MQLIPNDHESQDAIGAYFRLAADRIQAAVKFEVENWFRSVRHTWGPAVGSEITEDGMAGLADCTLPLPSPCCYFEGQMTSGDTLGVLALGGIADEFHTTFESFRSLGRDGPWLWSGEIMMVGRADTQLAHLWPWQRDSLTELSEQYAMAGAGAVGFILQLQSLHATTEQAVEPPAKLNAARATKGKAPLFGFRRIIIDAPGEVRSALQRATTHASPRPHYRRAHRRTLATGAHVPVKAAFVNFDGTPPTPGEYLVRPRPID